MTVYTVTGYTVTISRVPGYTVTDYTSTGYALIVYPVTDTLKNDRLNNDKDRLHSDSVCSHKCVTGSTMLEQYLQMIHLSIVFMDKYSH